MLDRVSFDELRHDEEMSRQIELHSRRVREIKRDILEGDGKEVIDLFLDEVDARLVRHLWKHYQVLDYHMMGEVVSRFMDGIVYSIADEKAQDE